MGRLDAEPLVLRRRFDVFFAITHGLEGARAEEEVRSVRDGAAVHGGRRKRQARLWWTLVAKRGFCDAQQRPLKRAL